MNHEFATLSHTIMLPPAGATIEAPCEKLINRLLTASFVLAEDWDALPQRVQRRILESKDEAKAIEQLVKHGLLTRYQAARIEAGTTFGLVLGSYRLLERLGAGGMAVVFKAEHMDLRHHVAVKVLPPTTKEDAALESRFFAEMRIVARLRHPNIVAATDAGKAVNDDTDTILRFLVMEYVPGQDLEDTIRRNGPMSVTRACSIAYQMASALGETHKYGLVHRDIKPSNIMLTSEDQAKLLDFGLTRHFGHRMTMPGTILGTIDYMAPEQARDASTVDIRADIYGLGGTLYWCLTGKLPFPFQGNPVEALTRRLTANAPSLRSVAPDMPHELDSVVAKMMALNPEDRYSDPQAVMTALMPFVRAGTGEYEALSPIPFAESIPCAGGSNSPKSGKYKVLIIDDESPVRELCKQLLETEGSMVETAANGAQGLAAATREEFDLVLLDVAMPDMNGVEVLARLRQQHKKTNLKVIMFSGHTTPEEMSDMLSRGADDFLTKPFSVAQLLARVQNMLRLKAAQDKAGTLNNRLLAANNNLQENLKVQTGDTNEVRNALVLTLARMIEQRDGRGPGHIIRMRQYCRTLATTMGRSGPYAHIINDQFIDWLECCSPLHDIGKVGLPDHVLTKVGALSPEERAVMEAHTVIAADSLKDVLQEHGVALNFLQTAIDVTRHHHERHDGTGYPDRLAGDAIPLSARVVAIADVYDALRCRRLYKPSLPHAAAMQIITQSSPGQFDPAILESLREVSAQFEKIFRETPD
ncbi:protein kinase domain-containing protein [Zavarzinella formosa]|uniref:protein kinase domain-containing protein n=1 Tax=Zavarzinella formosa TaxID=360055 RepID=UPI00036721C3|nr:response regulator [Zavarzinella formosa]